ncbi:MAG: nucleotide sugar dehydrogenase, partial [Saprospiraceae bacterium]
MFESLKTKHKALSVTGLGYVGLPLALEFAKHFRVIGFDINEERIAMMRRGEDPSKEIKPEAFADVDITFTSNAEDLRNAHFHIIGVPTDIDEHQVPDLNPLLKASASIGGILKRGDYVIYESTVYPGCTEEDCIPVLEAVSGLKRDIDFN